MSLRVIWQYMDRSVTKQILYGNFGPYNIFLVTERSIYCHMTLSAMNYLLYSMSYTFQQYVKLSFKNYFYRCFKSIGRKKVHELWNMQTPSIILRCVVYIVDRFQLMSMCIKYKFNRRDPECGVNEFICTYAIIFYHN